MEVRGRLVTSLAPDLERHLDRIRDRAERTRAERTRAGLPPDEHLHDALDDLLASVGELEELIRQLKTF
jgi:hypothetical protein